MLKYARAFLFIAFILSLNVSAQNQGATPATQARAAQTAAQDSKRLQTIQFQSKLVGQTLPYIVVLPVNYDQPAAKSERYPVLYLLHGLGGHYDNWATKTKLAEYARRYSMIVVTPEGNDSWYTDSATVPTEKYETYIVDELIPDVQRRYRTVETRAGRSIAGLSMGGYGALKFGVKHPELFAFAGSMSGALGAASWTESELRGVEFIFRTLQPVYGAEHSETRAANDLTKLFRELPAERIAALPFVYLDCGTEDPLLGANRSLAELLVSRKIPHEYRQL
ncbi:MAG TPA: alpha/beta hydrolase family protein, partial [Pyrinomonadaceae bacterium]